MDSDTEPLIPFAKIFRPTMDEFKDFQKFVETREKDPDLRDYGMYKVIPPPEWSGHRTYTEEELKKVVVHTPIEQNIQGNLGCYQLLLVPKKSMKLADFRKKVEPFDSFTKDKSIDEVENLFWSNIIYRPSIYGADVPNQTLFKKGTEWDLTDLPGLLKEGLHTHVLGVNSSYLYIGSWKALFGWHKEDIDLCSINYLHHGKPKFWYCLPPSEAKKLEDFAKTQFPEMFTKCKEFIRHKTIMINPYLLIQAIPDLKIHKMIQYPGEFVVTFGAAYHAGFNWGFNIAEAVNFATPRWLEILPEANSCTCEKDSVKMDKKEFLRNTLKSTKYSTLSSLKAVCLKCGIPREELNLKDDELANISIFSSNPTTPTPTPKRKALSSRKASTASSLKLDDSLDETSPSDSRQLKKSKKIRKMATTSSQKDSKAKNSISNFGNQNVEAARAEVKKILNQKKFKQLIFESWIQCDSCSKWRQFISDRKVSVDEMFKDEDFVCHKIGKRCEDPEEKESDESCIIKQTF